MTVVSSIVVAIALSMTSTGFTVSGLAHVTTIPPETITTSTYYDSASHKLTITCDVASRGVCWFTVVDGARARRFALRPKTRSVIANVSEKTRVCAVGRNPGVACHPAPVAT